MRVKNTKSPLILFLTLACAAIAFFGASRVSAAFLPDKTEGYVPLAPISVSDTTLDCKDGNGKPVRCTNLATYLTGMFKVGIAAAGVLAFLMIVYGGFQYLSTDAFTGKEEGKERIWRAMGGLVLALAAYIILNTINPQLVLLNLHFGDPAVPKSGLDKPDDEKYQKFIKDQNDRVIKAGENAQGLEDEAYDMLYEAENDPDLTLEQREWLVNEAATLISDAATTRALEPIASAGNIGSNAAHAGELTAAEGRLNEIKREVETGFEKLSTNSDATGREKITCGSTTANQPKITAIDCLESKGAREYSALAKTIATQAVTLTGLKDGGNSTAERMMININSVTGQSLAKINDSAVATTLDTNAKQAITDIKNACKAKNLPCQNWKP